MDRKIGAQLYTVREFCQNAQDFEETLKKLSAIGYKVIQLSTIGDIPAETIRELCDRYGMTVACTHRSLQDYTDRMDEMIHYHKTVGAKVAGIGGMGLEQRCDKETLMNTIEMFNRFSEQLGEHGLRFGYHNHAFEFSKFEGKMVMDYLIEYGKFDFILDTYWASYAGIDPCGLIQRLGKRASMIHFKDLAVDINSKVEIAEVGQGNLDWDKIIAASKDCEYALVEQDTCKGNPFDSLKISYDFLTKKGFE